MIRRSKTNIYEQNRGLWNSIQYPVAHRLVLSLKDHRLMDIRAVDSELG